MHFGISEGKGGLKHGSRPLLGMDIFWNCPIVQNSNCHKISHFDYFAIKFGIWNNFDVIFLAVFSITISMYRF